MLVLRDLLSVGKGKKCTKAKEISLRHLFAVCRTLIQKGVHTALLLKKEPMQGQSLFTVLQSSEKISLKPSRGANSVREEMIL